jgi:3-dehydroquinate synthase
MSPITAGPETLRVNTERETYPVFIERGGIARLPECLNSMGREFGGIFIVTTRDVWDLHGARLRQPLANRAQDPLFFSGGEENKRLASLELLAQQMSERGADRSSLVIAFGGGIVTDLAGFLASIYMRGIPVIQIPTTLLAQVDAAVGGKTGVNLKTGKNLIGTFHQPLAVIIDPLVLSTLSEREYRAGLYEIVKTGVIASAELFDLLENQSQAVFGRQPEILERIIAESVRIKAEVVSADEREGGLRRILNFGHTFGHALEAETAYRGFLHGEAVSWGMRAACYLARELDILSAPDCARVLNLLHNYGPIPSTAGIPAQSILLALLKDKKTIRGRVHFILPVRIGEVVVRSDVEPAMVLRSVERALADCR